MLTEIWRLRASFLVELTFLTLQCTHIITCDPQTLLIRLLDWTQLSKQACLLRNETKAKMVPRKRKLRRQIRLIMRAFRKTKSAKSRKRSVRDVNGISTETSYLKSVTRSLNSSITATIGTALRQLMVIIRRINKLTPALREWFPLFTWQNLLVCTVGTARAIPAQSLWMNN